MYLFWVLIGKWELDILSPISNFIMDNSSLVGFLRNRRLGSCLDPGSWLNMALPAVTVNAVGPQKKVIEDGTYEDEDGVFSVLISWLRIVSCFVSMMFTTLIWSMIMVVLLPWPHQRIRQGNIYGHVTGRMLMKILGNPIKIEGAEFSNERAIYICNHASLLDVFLIMWLTPTGSVGIAKKEIIFYPLFGQLYVLANHLRIDRSNLKAAVESMRQVADAVVKNNLSLIIFPEGTRSKNGRLLPFKKGFIHLALQTHRPIVPIVFAGTHHAWRKGSMHVRPAPITVKFLPPIRTDNWTGDKIDEYVKLVHDVYANALPASQRPVLAIL